MFNALIDAIGVQNYKQQVLDIATTNIALYTADGTILKRLGVEAMFRSDWENMLAPYMFPNVSNA